MLYFVGIKDFTGFLVMFLILFATTGIGNGSTYRMIPSIFREQNLHKARGKGEAARAVALKAASIECGRGGRLHRRDRCGRRLPDPARLRQVDRADRRPAARADVYLAFYALCLATTWWFYLRKGPETAGAPSLAEARM